MTTHNEQIHIPDDRWEGPILRFVESSPLAACATVGWDNGAKVVRADRPILTFSTGERHLWALLASLTSGDLRALLGHADSLTLAALSDMFARITMEAAA